MNWEKISLSEVIEKPVSGEWGDGEGFTKVIRTTNFTNEGTLDLSDVVCRNIPANKIDKKKLQFGDIIIEKSGGSPKQPVGRVVYFNIENEIYLCNNFTSVLRPKKGISSRYLFWCLFSGHVGGSTLSFQNKTTGIINLQLERYCNEFLIPIPPLHIQEQIANTLDKADALRRKDQELLTMYDELSLAIFYDMFGDPVKNERGWRNCMIKEVGEVITGSTPPTILKDMFGSDVPFYTPGDLETDAPIKRYLTFNGADYSRTVPPKATLVCCIGATIGKTDMTTTKAAFNQQINAIVWNEKLVQPDFGTFMIRLYKSSFRKKFASATTLPIINKSTFEKICCIVPPSGLQNKFNSFIQKIDIQRRFTQKNIHNSENLFDRTIDSYFS